MKLKEDAVSSNTNASEISVFADTAGTTTAVENHTDPATSPSSFSYIPYTPLENASEFQRSASYNGGSRGSTRDKKRFFEMIANKQQEIFPSSTEHLLNRKIELGGVASLPSDTTTVVSGYDSVGPDFVLNQSTTATEGSSCDVTEEDWPQDCIPPKGWPYEHLLTNESISGTVVEKEGTLKPDSDSQLHPAQSQSMPSGYETPSANSQQQAPFAVASSAISVDPVPGTPTTLMSSTPKWSVKTEGQNDVSAEGSVEIPQRRSVASLRKQIATKLEVKSPTSIGPVPHSPTSPRVLANGDSKAKWTPAPLSSAGVPANTQAKENLGFFNTAARGLYQIVHEPMKRHISRITPLPFRKPTLSFSSLNNAEPEDATFTGPGSGAREANSVNLLLDPESFVERSKRATSEFTTRTNIESSKMPSFPTYRTLDRHVGLSTVQLYGSEKEENSMAKYGGTAKNGDGSKSANPQMVEASCSTDYSTHISNSVDPDSAQTSKANEMYEIKSGIPDEATGKKTVLEAPFTKRETDTVSGGTAGTIGRDPPQAADNSAATAARQTTISSSGAKEVESGLHNENYGPASVPTFAHTNDRASAQNDSLNWSPNDTSLNQDQSASSSKNDFSDTSLWYKDIFKKMHRIPEKDQSILRYQMRDVTSPQPHPDVSRAYTPTFRSDSRIESRLDYECLPRRSKSVGRYGDLPATRDEEIVARWREERAKLSSQDQGRSNVSSPSLQTPESRPGKPGVHLETINEELTEKASASDISERLELANEQLHKLINDLRTRHSRSPGASPFLSPNSVTSQLTDSRLSVFKDMKRLSKEEIMNRQRVEKLSVELEEQRNRRHGYVPSASPSLQKNFDRFNGLLNNFGREERCVTPRRSTIPAVATCTATYSFKAQNPRELSFNRGDVIRIHRTVDANWMEGERNGQTGIFPSSYVQIDDYLPYEQRRVLVLYPFYARNKNELTLKKGEIIRYRRTIDANWIEGVNAKGEIGIFPKTYVQDYGPELNMVPSYDGQIPDRPKTPKLISPALREESQTPLTKMPHQSDVEAWQKRHLNQGLLGVANFVPKNSETYRAVYAYAPRNSDELELQENDIVFVVEKCDDGWYIGTSLRTAQFGTFPGNYVERH